MAQVRWTEAGSSWMERVHQSIAADSVRNADRVVESLMERVEWLGQSPLLGYRIEHDSDHHIRVLVHGHYRVVYLVEDDAVVVVGVYHTPMNFVAYLDNDLP